MPIVIKPAAVAAVTLLLGALQAVAGIAILATVAFPARAAEVAAFTIPAEDGYGVEDCMQAGTACGQVMADSWCVAHGHLKAIAFGASADVTGSVTAARAAPIAADATLIRCGD